MESRVTRDASGWLRKHIGHGQIIRGAAFSQYLTRTAGAAPTLGANTKLFAKLAHGTDTAVGGFADFSVCYTMAKAYVHGGHSQGQ